MSHRASGAIIEWGCVGGTCNNPEGSKPGNVTLDACQQTLRGLRKPALLVETRVLYVRVMIPFQQSALRSSARCAWGQSNAPNQCRKRVMCAPGPTSDYSLSRARGVQVPRRFPQRLTAGRLVPEPETRPRSGLTDIGVPPSQCRTP
ncbi:hypothetical protein KL919_001695 [Ogataea angusta]|nr:hypothetical protein KL943_000429 [Ogataea angusta]KAG7862565.1 hypothetical protein KL919_001695 [Ogataea angusta]